MPKLERVRDFMTAPPSGDYFRDKKQPRAGGWWRSNGNAARRPKAPPVEDVPFGLRVASDCKRLEEDPDELQVLILMMETIVQDGPLSQAARTINERGYRTRDGEKWTPQALFYLLPQIDRGRPAVVYERRVGGAAETSVQRRLIARGPVALVFWLAYEVSVFAFALCCPLFAAKPAIAIVDVTVVDIVTAALHPHQTVVIADDRIASIGANAPAGTRVVNGRGKFLIPGLWDMHVHLWYAKISFRRSSRSESPACRTWAAISIAPRRGAMTSIPARPIGPHIVTPGPPVDGQPSDDDETSGAAREHSRRKRARPSTSSGIWTSISSKSCSGLSRDAYFALAEQCPALARAAGGPHSRRRSPRGKRSTRVSAVDRTFLRRDEISFDRRRGPRFLRPVRSAAACASRRRWFCGSAWRTRRRSPRQ